MEQSWHSDGTLPTPTLNQIERQKRWEASAVDDAITQYHSDLFEVIEHQDGTTTRRPKQLGDTAVGPKILREILGDRETYGVALAFQKLRAEIIDNIANGGQGRRAEWLYIMADRDPLELSVVVIRALMSVRFTKNAIPMTMSDVSSQVANLIQDQYELDAWRKESKAQAKESGEKDLAKILMASVRGNVDRKTYHRWRKKVKDIQRLTWPIKVRRQLGAALVQTAVDASGGWFEISLQRSGRKTTRYVHLTDLAKEAIRSIREDQSFLRPRHNPMVCPPLPWQPTEEKEAA